MKTAKPTRLSLGGILFAVALGVNVLLGASAMLVAHPTEAHRELSREILIDNATVTERLAAGETISDSDFPTRDSTEMQHLSRVEAGKLIAVIVVNAALVVIGYRSIRQRITKGAVENVVAVAVAGGIVIASIVHSLLLPLYVGAPLSTAGYAYITTYIGLAATAVISLLLTGIVAHVLEKLHKKRHSFEIE